MPRTARASVGGLCYHAINRGNGRAAVFHKDADYHAFVELIAQACERIPMRVLGYCLMPNHFHLAVWPYGDGELSRWMQWLLTAHVRRYHQHHGTSGHVWQGRFKAFPIQQDTHLLTVLRYIEANPLRAKLVTRAEEWPWSSLSGRRSRNWGRLLYKWPVDQPSNWTMQVNQTMPDGEVDVVRRSVNRGTPFGAGIWVSPMATRLGLESSLRPRGRPRKNAKK